MRYEGATWFAAFVFRSSASELGVCARPREGLDREVRPLRCQVRADEASAADGRGVLAGETPEAWKRSHCRALLVQWAAASMIAFVESRPVVRPVAKVIP